MKVNTWKNIDVECEVEVSLEDCITELLDTTNDKEMPTRLALAIDGATKILERITPDMISDVLTKNAGALPMIRQRIQKWIDAT